MNTTNFRFKTAAAIAVVLFFTVSVKATTLFENFDNPGSTVKSFTGGGADIVYSSGTWHIFVNVMTENDKYNGTSGVRIRGYAGASYTTMMFNKVGGAGVVSFKYGSYSNHNGGEFILQKSINNGTNWEDVGTKVTVPKWSGTFLTYSVAVNEAADVRFRISMTVTTNANTLVNIDDWMITDFGTEQVAMPTSSVPTGIYETPQTVKLSSTTAGATIYYTTDGTQPTTASNVYSTPLNVTTTTKIRTYAVAAGKVDSREDVILISFPEQVATLAEFYTKMATTGTNPTYYKFTGEAIVTASYTATYKTVFFQDNTAGMLLSDNYKNTTVTNAIGDKVTGLIAQVNRINDSPQLYTYNDFTVISTGNTIVPPVVTLADVPTKTNQLVQINELTFDEANGTKIFNPNSPYIIHDASLASTTTTFRTPASMVTNPDYVTTIIPSKRNVIVLVAKNSAQMSTHYIFARNAADLDVQLSGINLPKTFNLSTSGTTVFFETVAPEAVKVFSVSGQAVKSTISVVGKNSLELSKGVYIIRIGDKAAKVLL